MLKSKKKEIFNCAQCNKYDIYIYKFSNPDINHITSCNSLDDVNINVQTYLESLKDEYTDIIGCHTKTSHTIDTITVDILSEKTGLKNKHKHITYYVNKNTAHNRHVTHSYISIKNVECKCQCNRDEILA